MYGNRESDTPNVYYHPEHYGLEVIGDIEWDNEAWQFNMTVVWRDQAGNFYYADDSGCSCPSPFEDLTLERLTRVERLQDLIDHLTERASTERYFDNEAERNKRMGDAGDLIMRVRALV